MNELKQEYFGMKELSSVVIKATAPIKIGNKVFEKDEPVLFFEKVQIANINENAQIIPARGGQGNYPHVIWEDVRETHFIITEGVLTRMGLAMMSNADILEKSEEVQSVIVPKTEHRLEVDIDGSIRLKYFPAIPEKSGFKKIFAFLLNDRGEMEEKVFVEKVEEDKIYIDSKYAGRKVLAEYYFEYKENFFGYILGAERFNGFLRLEAKMYAKDDKEGLDRTIYFEIPKMRIVSNLNITVGEQVPPTSSGFNIVASPVKEGGKWLVSKMYMLEDDIDSVV